MKSNIFLIWGLIPLAIGTAHKDERKKNVAGKEGKNSKYAIAACFIVAFFLAIYFSYLAGSKVTDFESCAAAGNPVIESYPKRCRADGVTYVGKISDILLCAHEQRNAEVSAAICAPVCAKVNIQCITTPCNPIDVTLSNSCEACKNPLVESYRMGECL